jgi:hypothetical protein
MKIQELLLEYDARKIDIKIVELFESQPQKKHFVGTCVDSFDLDGECVVPELGWANTSDFAVADESASNISREEFVNRVIMPPQLQDLIRSPHMLYLETSNGVLMAYDSESDVHYFFV